MLFLKGCLKMPVIWQLWMFVLFVINGVMPFYFLDHNIAIITIVSMSSGVMIGEYLTRLQGFTKLLGLMHATWIPLFAFQFLIFINDEKLEEDFELWLLSSFSVTFISLIIDFVDVIKYIKGNKVDLLLK